MKTIYTQSVEEAKQPRGFVWWFDIMPATIPVYKWNNLLKFKEWVDDKEDLEHYVEPDKNFHYHTLSYNQCRLCHQIIKPYKDTYYKKTFEDWSWQSLKMNQELCYCEECAIKESTNVQSDKCNTPTIVRTYEYTWTDPFGIRTEWSDGSVTERDKDSLMAAKKEVSRY